MRSVEFSGYTWEVKRGEGRVGPGPNYFSDEEEWVTIRDEKLCLSIKPLQGIWRCSEVALTTPLGFGTYRFTVESPLTPFEKPAVFGAFLYENDGQEIDVEVSPGMVGKRKAQFVVQPGRKRGNLHKFRLPASPPTTYSIHWRDNSIECRAWHNGSPISTWVYPGPGIVSPLNARFIFNLWLYRGKTAKNVQEVIVSDFSFTPD